MPAPGKWHLPARLPSRRTAGFAYHCSPPLGDCQSARRGLLPWQELPFGSVAFPMTSPRLFRRRPNRRSSLRISGTFRATLRCGAARRVLALRLCPQLASDSSGARQGHAEIREDRPNAPTGCPIAWLTLSIRMRLSLGADVDVAVPLHKVRRRERGFNPKVAA
jgi:hypothetical protein